MNTRFDYVYRDAANYKTDYSFVFEGELSEDQIEKFIEACDDDLFIPRALGLPGGFLIDDPGYDAEFDHYWCEHDFEDSFELVDAEPDEILVCGKRTVIKAEEFLELVSRCSNWEHSINNPFNVFDLRREKGFPPLEEQIKDANARKQPGGDPPPTPNEMVRD